MSLTPDQINKLKKAADDYIRDDRPTEQPIILGGFTEGGKIKPAGASKTLKELTVEVNCSFDTCLLEIIYGIESTFGNNQGGTTGGDGPNGQFQLIRSVAVEAGLKVMAQNDEREDLGKAAKGAAFLVYTLARQLTFSTLNSIPGMVDCGGSVKCDCCTPPLVGSLNSECSRSIRKLILVGYNAGGTVLAFARCLTKKAGGDPTSFTALASHLDEALKKSGMTDDVKRAAKLKEVTEYVEKYDVLREKLCSQY